MQFKITRLQNSEILTVISLTGCFLQISGESVGLLLLLPRDWNLLEHWHKATGGNIRSTRTFCFKMHLTIYSPLVYARTFCSAELDHLWVLIIMIVLLGRRPWLCCIRDLWSRYFAQVLVLQFRLCLNGELTVMLFGLQGILARSTTRMFIRKTWNNTRLHSQGEGCPHLCGDNQRFSSR